jgi:hypothetical protein
VTLTVNGVDRQLPEQKLAIIKPWIFWKFFLKFRKWNNVAFFANNPKAHGNYSCLGFVIFSHRTRICRNYSSRTNNTTQNDERGGSLGPGYIREPTAFDSRHVAHSAQDGHLFRCMAATLPPNKISTIKI